MDKQRILYLHNHYLQENLTAQEFQEWNGHLKNPESREILENIMNANWEIITDQDVINLRENRSDEIFDYIMVQPQAKIKKKILWFGAAVAAAIIIILSTGVFYFQHRSIQSTNQLAQNISAAKNSATLTLANGKKIVLSDATNGELTKESGVSISKTANGRLVYQIKETGVLSNGINTLTTFKGETYDVILPDGSKITLNAATSIKYPSNFSSFATRKVELNGEAYFEVAKDKAHPFIVKTRDQEVEVLGTHFNINAYFDDENIKTTLLEGSVKIYAKELKNSVVLKPGQMAINSLNGAKLNVSGIDVEDETAWKNGYFIFNNENIKDIMKKLSRWYDFDVSYQGDMSDIEFQGNYLRSRSLPNLLKTIELTNKVEFKVEGRRIKVIKVMEN